MYREPRGRSVFIGGQFGPYATVNRQRAKNDPERSSVEPKKWKKKYAKRGDNFTVYVDNCKIQTVTEKAFGRLRLFLTDLRNVWRVINGPTVKIENMMSPMHRSSDTKRYEKRSLYKVWSKKKNDNF